MIFAFFFVILLFSSSIKSKFISSFVISNDLTILSFASSNLLILLLIWVLLAKTCETMVEINVTLNLLISLFLDLLNIASNFNLFGLFVVISIPFVISILNNSVISSIFVFKV